MAKEFDEDETTGLEKHNLKLASLSLTNEVLLGRHFERNVFLSPHVTTETYLFEASYD